MGKGRYKVREVARLARVTVRTLHHYDAIGLLRPSQRTETGYRLYDEDDLLRLQEILVSRELGMPLEGIKRAMDNPRFDRRRALLDHRASLVERARRVEAMIRSIDAAIEALKGEERMRESKLFEGFDAEEYEEEAQRRWGATKTYREAARRTRSYSKDDWALIREENGILMRKLAECQRGGASAKDVRVLQFAEQHRQHIDRWFYPCDHRMHSRLADLYVSDDRFTASLEKHGAGLAAFLATAIRANASRRRESAR